MTDHEQRRAEERLRHNEGAVPELDEKTILALVDLMFAQKDIIPS